MDNQATGTSPTISASLSDDPAPDRLQELERFAEIGRLSASLLHEISNPLTAAMLWLEEYGNQQSTHIRHIRHSIGLLQRYVEAARQQIRRESRLRNFSIQKELETVKRILVPLARRHGIKLRFAPAAGCTLYGDPVKFQQIVTNLFTNAIDAYENIPCGTKNKRVALYITSRDDYILIKVRDYGCGISNDQLSHLFQPFYSTKSRAGRGLGIGLFDVKRYVEADFQGSIEVSSSPSRGTCFMVKFKSGSPASTD